MSNLQPLAFSPIETGPDSLRTYELTESILRNLGFHVLRFPVYDGDPGRNIAVAEEILDRSGGLLVERMGFFRFPEQDAALFDRIDVATKRKKPIFVQGDNWKELSIGDLEHEEANPSGLVALRSAKGIAVRDIIKRAEVVTTSPREAEGPHESMRRRLTT